jgi:hypothetical protein
MYPYFIGVYQTKHAHVTEDDKKFNEDQDWKQAHILEGICLRFGEAIGSQGMLRQHHEMWKHPGDCGLKFWNDTYQTLIVIQPIKTVYCYEVLDSGSLYYCRV